MCCVHNSNDIFNLTRKSIFDHKAKLVKCFFWDYFGNKAKLPLKQKEALAALDLEIRKMKLSLQSCLFSG